MWSSAARQATAIRCRKNWKPAASYLERQIQAINPKVIVTLGRFSMAHFLPNAKISESTVRRRKSKGGWSSPCTIRQRLCTNNP